MALDVPSAGMGTQALNCRCQAVYVGRAARLDTCAEYELN